MAAADQKDGEPKTVVIVGGGPIGLAHAWE